MNNPQQPREYDAVLGGNSPSLEGAAVLGGIEGVKLRLQNPDAKVRIAALEQALNYGEQGLDLVIAGLKDESWEIQNAAYLILNSRTEPRIKPRIARYFTEDVGNGVKLEMAAIPGGTFMMGSPENEAKRRDSENPQHQVTVPGFFMGKYPVTQAQYQAIMGTNPSYFKGSNRRNRPVESVSWNDAVKFCKKLSQRTGKTSRLPSEAEWEYACRAGTTTPFHFGETITTDLANYNGNYTYASAPRGEYREQTTDVGSFPPNAFGLYDMHGNVWEWCLDDWVNSYNNALTNGSAVTSSSSLKLLRGGSWYYTPENCRSAFRHYINLDYNYYNIGFRVVCSGAART